MEIGGRRLCLWFSAWPAFFLGRAWANQHRDVGAEGQQSNRLAGSPSTYGRGPSGGIRRSLAAAGAVERRLITGDATTKVNEENRERGAPPINYKHERDGAPRDQGRLSLAFEGQSSGSTTQLPVNKRGFLQQDIQESSTTSVARLGLDDRLVRNSNLLTGSLNASRAPIFTGASSPTPQLHTSTTGTAAGPTGSSVFEDVAAKAASPPSPGVTTLDTGDAGAAGLPTGASAPLSGSLSFPGNMLALEETANTSGDAVISKTMGERLYDDSKSLGSAAEQLLGVQADLNRVQNEVQGQVFDLQTVRQFFTEHQYLSASKRQLEEKNQALQHQVATIGAEFAEAQRSFANQTAVLTRRMQVAEAAVKKTAEEEAQVEKEYIGHRVAIVEDEKIRSENKELLERMEHMNRLESAKNQAEQEAGTLSEKAKESARFSKELQETIRSLRSQVQSLQASLTQKDAVLVEHVRRLKTGAQKVEEADKTHILSLEQTTTVLRGKLQEKEKQVVELTGKNKELEELVKSIQSRAVDKFEQLKAKIGQYKTHVVSLRESVAQNIVARKSAEAEAARLTQMLLKSDSETLKRQLDEVKKAHAQAQDDLRDMSGQKAKAEAALVEEESARAAAENIAAIEKQAAAKARLEKTEGVAQCEKQKSAELAEKGKEVLACQTAMNSMEQQKCGERWAELNKESVAQIEKCKQEIPMLREKVTTLSSEKAVLKAAATGKLCSSGEDDSGSAGSATAGSTPAVAATANSALVQQQNSNYPLSLSGSAVDQEQDDLPDEAADQAAITAGTFAEAEPSAS
ncbi:unnamed protein product [Amoebophrya sp. A120]|nr:unnamed protein product [Amoebophrya sp. A120]|eukprot:GSA120T00015195001.1